MGIHLEQGRTKFCIKAGDKAAALAAANALENIHALLYADGPGTQWNADTLSAVADELAKIIPRPGKGAAS